MSEAEQSAAQRPTVEELEERIDEASHHLASLAGEPDTDSWIVRYLDEAIEILQGSPENLDAFVQRWKEEQEND